VERLYRALVAVYRVRIQNLNMTFKQYLTYTTVFFLASFTFFAVLLLPTSTEADPTTVGDCLIATVAFSITFFIGLYSGQKYGKK
jgi:hypothetical protein